MPNVEQLTFESQRAGETQNGRLRAIFLGRPNEWIAMPELGELIGAYAVHSRVADLRRLFGMEIRQRNEGMLGPQDCAAESERAIAKLNAQLKSSKEFSEAASKRYQEMAKGLSEVTTFTDEAILNVITKR